MDTFSKQHKYIERTIGRIGRVDEAAGILFEVKIAGFHSQNGRFYEREAVERSVHLVAGVKVFNGHESKRDGVGNITRTKPPWVGIRVGSVGDVSVMNSRGDTVTHKNCEVGEIVRGQIQQVLSATTTVTSPTTNMVGLQ